MTVARPTGDQLLDELRTAAAAKGVPLYQFVAPLAPTKKPEYFLAQLRRAGRPLPLTVERVRACIEGRPIPASRVSPFRGHRTDPARLHKGDPQIGNDAIEARRRLTDRAHAERLPGETLHQAIQRISERDAA